MRRLTTLVLIALVSLAPLALPSQGRAAGIASARHGAPSFVGARPMIRVSPPPGPRLSSVNANLTSTNWSGYAAATNLNSTSPNSVTDVTGTWVVPTVTGGTVDAYCADWIGIDGLQPSNGSVEQLGTEEDWIGGAPVYLAWWEMYPGASQSIVMTIHPGDVMSAHVRWVSGNTFKLSMTDVTTGASFSTQQAAPGITAAGSSAEWIHEAPSSTGGVLALAQTTPATFSACGVTINGTTGPINDVLWQHTGIDMIDGVGTVIAQTDPLTASGTSFVVAPPSAPSHISASSASLTFDYTVGGPTPPAQQLTFTNTGGGSLNWGAASDSPSWLTCTPSSGTSGGSTSVSVNPASLTVGAHVGHFSVTAAGADNTPLNIPVTLNVHAAPPPLDTTPPTTALHALPVANSAGWNDADVAVGLDATDNLGGSGVASTNYMLDGVQHSYSGTFTISAEGIHTLDFWSVDASGNVETAKSATLRIDKTPPTLSLDATASYAGSAVVHASASDALSGLDHVEMRLDGGAWSTVTQLSTSALGPHTVDSRAFDLAGNQRDVSANFTVTGVDTPPVIDTAVATPTTPTVGSAVRLVGSAHDPDGDTLLGYQWQLTQSPAGSSAAIAAPTSADTTFTPDVAGTYRFRLQVTDSAGLSATSGLVTVTAVNAPPVQISRTTSTGLSGPSSVKVHRWLKLTGTVSPSAAPGVVTIKKTRLVGKAWRGAGVVRVNVVAGRFSYSFKPTVRGRWHFVATYSGGVVGTTTYAVSKSGIKSVRVM